MIDFIKRLFGFSVKPVEVAPSAPYKVPEPDAITPEVVEVAPAPAPAPEQAPAKPKGSARTAKPKATAPAKATAKAPTKPRASKAKPQV
jgi:hypothetical protein